MSRCTLAACTLAAMLLTTPAAQAEPIVTITDDWGTLPNEAFFAANPTAVVNVEGDGVISPGEHSDPFDFGGASVNINNRGALGWYTLTPFVDHASFTLSDGGIIHDRATFVGEQATSLSIVGGVARGRLTMRGVSTLNVSGGTIGGGQPQGAASLIAEGDSQVVVTGGVIGKSATIREQADVTVSAGEVGDWLTIEGSGLVTIAGGEFGRLLNTKGSDARLDITGGTIGREFMHTGGVVNMSGGAIDENSAVIGAVMNMSGGALGAGFKLSSGGTLNMSGGTFGDYIRVGAFGGGPGTLNLMVKSAFIDGELLPLDVGATVVIDRRDDAFLVAELAQGGSVGLTLNDDVTTTDDFIRANSTLTVTRWAAPGDYNLDGDVDGDDLADWQTAFGVGQAGSGLLTWQRDFETPATTAALAASAVPEPASALLFLGGLATLALQRRKNKLAAAQ